MKIPPSKGPSGTPPTGKSEGPSGPKPKQNFDDILKRKSQDRRSVERRGEKTDDDDKKKKRKTEPGPAVIKQKEEEKPLQGGQATGGQKEGQIGSVTGRSGGSGGASTIEKVQEVFQNNPVFGSQVATWSERVEGTQTIITIAMQNGVEVSIDFAAGGKDLNITVMGLSPEAQAIADSSAHQDNLTQKLAQEGLTLHWIRTGHTAEARTAFTQPTEPAPTAPPSEGQPTREQNQDREGRGDQDQPQPEEEE